MPTSSTSRQLKANGGGGVGGRSYWPNQKAKNDQQRQQSRPSTFQKRAGSSASSIQQQEKQTKHLQIKHISPPSSLTSTSVALRNSIIAAGGADLSPMAHTISTHPDRLAKDQQEEEEAEEREQDEERKRTGGSQQTLSLGGHLVLAGPKPQPCSNSLSSLENSHQLHDHHKHHNHHHHHHHHHENDRLQQHHKSTSFLISNAQFNPTATSSQNSLTNQLGQHNSSPSSNKQSKAGLNFNLASANQSNSHHQQQTLSSGLSIKRNVNLKYVKTLIILLLAVDLLITVFVHQFSSQDQLSMWFTSYKLRFSLLNLVLSSIWFIILIGAILFDVYLILFISCIVDVLSFGLLLVFSVIHFSRRIDYATVNLTSLLALLFSIVVLHVYLIVMSTLTIYLTIAVKRRNRLAQLD